LLSNRVREASGLAYGLRGCVREPVRFSGQQIGSSNGAFGLRGGRLHFGQLLLHRGSLIPHKADLVLGSGVSSFASSPHFGQLPLHGGQLAVENEILRDSGPSRDNRGEGDNPRSPLSAPRRAIYSGIMGLLGAALLALAFEIMDAPRNPASFVVCAAGCGLFAAVLICQATILALTGHWLP
jgi:hypothetical protein